jgi:hypothetical protein
LLTLHALGQGRLSGLQPGFGLLCQEIARSQESGGDDEHEQDRGAAHSDDQRQLARLARGLDAARQRLPVLLQELIRDVTNMIHQELAAIGQYERLGTLGISRALQEDGFLQLSQFLIRVAL